MQTTYHYFFPTNNNNNNNNKNGWKKVLQQIKFAIIFWHATSITQS